jgi:hypothetical protein
MDTQNKRTSEEIDLLYFFNPLLKGFTLAKKNIPVYLRHLRRNFLVFLVVFALVVLAGYSLRYILPQTYRTSATFISYHFGYGYFAPQANQLAVLAGEKDGTLLARQLDIPVPVATAIKSISTEPANELLASYNEAATDATAAFRVHLVINDLSSLDQVQQGLQQYFENNEFARKRKEAKRKMLELQKKNLLEKSGSLDSLKQGTGPATASPGHALVPSEKVIQVQVYELQARFYKELLAIDEELNMLDKNIELIQPFSKSGAVLMYNVKKLFIQSIIAGFLLALVITGLVGQPGYLRQ